MEQGFNYLRLAWVFLALVVGLGGGYYYGNTVGVKDGTRRGIEQGILQEKAMVEARRKDAEKETAKAVNPFQQATANPFEKTPTNPFEKVKINPFE